MISRIKRKALLIWRRSIFGRVKKNPGAIRWGIIGLGYMAETFANAIDGNKNGYVAAVASRSIDKAKRFASRHGHCRAYGTYYDMLQDSSLQLDIVYVATPIKCHYENVKACLENGKSVLCEKPITFTSSELKELMEIARTHKCFLMEGMWMKCLPTFRKGNEWIRNGAIGEVEFIRVDFYKREHRRPEYAIYDANMGGGVIRDFGVYALAFMTHLLNGKPDKLTAQSRIDSSGLDTDWQISASKNSIKVSINLSSDFDSLSKAVVVGSEGSIEWNSQFNRTNCIRRYDKNGVLLESFQAKYKFDGFEYEVDEAQRCIKENMAESYLVPLEMSLATLDVLEEITASNE